MRVKRGFVRHHRHKKIRAMAKGYKGMQHTTFVRANQAVIKAGQHAYRARRLKKRTFRGLWITRLNAGLRERGVGYARFVKGLRDQKVVLNRKVLSELALHEPKVFEDILKAVVQKL